MSQDKGASADADRATRASTEPASGLGHSAGIPSAAREQRWFRRFETAPLDGTAIILPCIIRYNPAAWHWEALTINPETERMEWTLWGWSDNNRPNWWCPMLPLSFELPNKGLFALQHIAKFEVKHASPWARVCHRLFRWLSFATAADWKAQAIEARRAETGTGSVHESAVGEADAPNPNPLNPGT